MKCKDCKWLVPEEIELHGSHKKKQVYICKSPNKKRHHHSKNIKYDIKQFCQIACKSGFEPKED